MGRYRPPHLDIEPPIMSRRSQSAKYAAGLWITNMTLTNQTETALTLMVYRACGGKVTVATPVDWGANDLAMPGRSKLRPFATTKAKGSIVAGKSFIRKLSSVIHFPCTYFCTTHAK